MLNAAVVGLGFMGQNHARTYAQRKDINLIAICDTDEKKGKVLAKKLGINYYSNHLDLIKNEKLDAVSIAVPTYLHTKISLDFINHGINLLVEKPLAPTSTQAKIILKKAKENNVVLLVGHIERFNPAIIEIKKLMDKGEFGEILSFVIKRVGLYPPRIKDVNVVTDLAVHDLDIITYLTGKLPNYIVSGGGSSLNKNQEDHAEIFLLYEKFGCFIQVNWVTPLKIRTFSITGSKKYAELNLITQKIEIYKNENLIKNLEGFQDFVSKYGEPQKYKLKIKTREPLSLEIDNFIQSIEGKQKPLVTGEDGLKAIQLSEFVLKSIRKGTGVKVYGNQTL